MATHAQITCQLATTTAWELAFDGMAQSNKLAFLSMEAPPNYVAGAGRGASGFTTRSDIGPAREGPSAETIAAARARRGEDDDDERYQDPEDETALFASAAYEKDDEEADRVWESVDRRMEDRRRRQREAREAAEREAERAAQPKIQAQFADLKRNLASVSDAEWAALPEPGNLTGKRRKAAAARESRDGRTFAVPDSVLVSARDQNAVQNTAADVDGTVSSLTEIGEARNKVFEHTLDQASSSSAVASSGLSSTVDPAGYLTALSGVSVKSDVEIGDIKKARSLLDSVIRTNPKHAPGWIAAARLEEIAGKMAVARRVAAQGCEQCPRSEDIWLESARLHTPDNARVILARAIQFLSHSVAIWTRAASLERDTESRKRVLRKALEHIPQSVRLWKELVNLEESPEDARVLLAGAVDAVPLSVELWLALARLSAPDDAKSVLNRARRTIPTSHEIWIAAARLLEETGEPPERIDKTIAAAVAALTRAGALLSRDQWLREAEQVERDGSVATAAAIVRATIHLDLDEEDRARVWVEDAQTCAEHGRPATARAILGCALAEFPDDLGIWRAATALEQVHGSRASLTALLDRGVAACPSAEGLWLLYAREVGPDAGRDVLRRAAEANPRSEGIALAAAEAAADADTAAAILEHARADIDSVRVWAASVYGAWRAERVDAALALARDALARFPHAAELHDVYAQLLLRAHGDVRAVREALAAGRRACPDDVRLWLRSAALEEEHDAAIRARALLEKARQTHGQSEAIWAESVAVELRAGSVPQARTLLSRALQACPTSGRLLSMAIWLEPKPARKTRAADALRRSGDSAEVICTVARLFWDEGKDAQARAWFEKAVQAARHWGDGWAWWYAFECERGSGEHAERLCEKVERAAPLHGAVWTRVAEDLAPARTAARTLLPRIAGAVRADADRLQLV